MSQNKLEISNKIGVDEYILLIKQNKTVHT